MKTARSIIKAMMNERSDRPAIVSDRDALVRIAFATEVGAVVCDGTAVPDYFDLSASTEARATLAKRSDGQRVFEDELATAERDLISKRIGQAAFNTKCQRIAAKPITTYPERDPFEPRWTPKIGTANDGPLPDQVDMPKVPGWLNREAPAVFSSSGPRRSLLDAQVDPVWSCPTAHLTDTHTAAP